MNKLKPQEKAERYIIAPSTSMYLGVKVTKDTDISDKVKNEFGTTYQTIKDLTLTTIVKRKSNAYDMETKEHSKLTQKVKEGTILVWIPNKGYVVPEMNVCTVQEGIDALQVLRDLEIEGEKEENKE